VSVATDTVIDMNDRDKLDALHAAEAGARAQGPMQTHLRACADGLLGQSV